MIPDSTRSVALMVLLTESTSQTEKGRRDRLSKKTKTECLLPSQTKQRCTPLALLHPLAALLSCQLHPPTAAEGAGTPSLSCHAARLLLEERLRLGCSRPSFRKAKKANRQAGKCMCAACVIASSKGNSLALLDLCTQVEIEQNKSAQTVPTSHDWLHA